MRFTPIPLAPAVMVALLVGCANAPERAKPSGLPSSSGGDRIVISQEVTPLDAIAVAKLDVVPIARFQARPLYPLALRRAGLSGEAVVDFIIDVNGDVRNAYAIRASHPDFGAAAAACVAQWKFQPGRKGGRIVNTHMQVPIVFSIN